MKNISKKTQKSFTLFSFWAVLTLICVSFLSMDVQAETENPECITVDLSESILQSGGLGEHDPQDEPSDDGTYTSQIPLFLSDSLYEEAANTIYTGIMARQSSINISSYNLTPNQLRSVFSSVMNTHADLFFVQSAYSYMPNGQYTSYF